MHFTNGQIDERRHKLCSYGECWVWSIKAGLAMGRLHTEALHHQPSSAFLLLGSTERFFTWPHSSLEHKSFNQLESSWRWNGSELFLGSWRPSRQFLTAQVQMSGLDRIMLSLFLSRAVLELIFQPPSSPRYRHKVRELLSFLTYSPCLKHSCTPLWLCCLISHWQNFVLFCLFFVLLIFTLGYNFHWVLGRVEEREKHID